MSPDIKIRRKMLEVLKEFFEKDPDEYVSKEEMIERTGCSEVEVLRNMKYLDDKGKARVEWATGGYFSAMITAAGIDSLKEPTIFEKETIFMKNAYSLLYRIENELRIFIEQKLRERYDDEWWERGVPMRIRRRTEEKREPDSPFSLIYYTEFADLRKIIMKTENWRRKRQLGTLTLREIRERLIDRFEQFLLNI